MVNALIVINRDLEDASVASDMSIFTPLSSVDDSSDESSTASHVSQKHRNQRTRHTVQKRRRLTRGDACSRPRQRTGDVAVKADGMQPSCSKSRTAASKKKKKHSNKSKRHDPRNDKNTIATTTTQHDDRNAAATTWTDDGSLDLYRRRLHDLRREWHDSVTQCRKTFYNDPKPVVDFVDAKADEGEGRDIEMKGRQERDEEESEVETRVTHYSPWDVTETASGLLVPSYVLTQLLPHQRECLEWLHKLHERGVGGILGDDMGLGKTVQLASFVGSLHRARRLRTVLLLCPASVLLQWVRELHKWTPWMRVVLLHASGTGVNTSSSSACYEQLIEETFCYENDVLGGEEEEEEMGYHERGEHAPTGGGVVISTYENVRQYQSLFLTREWDYVVLDEGHRIRNPDAETTLACKQLRTIHRIILSGTPIQNRLRELWSLFDFVYPGRLGTLPTFEDEFVLPIRAGGYIDPV